MSEAVRRMSGGGSDSPRHFIDIKDHDSATLRQMLDIAANYKAAGKDVQEGRH